MSARVEELVEVEFQLLRLRRLGDGTYKILDYCSSCNGYGDSDAKPDVMECTMKLLDHCKFLEKGT